MSDKHTYVYIYVCTYVRISSKKMKAVAGKNGTAGADPLLMKFKFSGTGNVCMSHTYICIYVDM